MCTNRPSQPTLNGLEIIFHSLVDSFSPMLKYVRHNRQRIMTLMTGLSVVSAVFVVFELVCFLLRNFFSAVCGVWPKKWTCYKNSTTFYHQFWDIFWVESWDCCEIYLFTRNKTKHQKRTNKSTHHISWNESYFIQVSSINFDTTFEPVKEREEKGESWRCHLVPFQVLTSAKIQWQV